MNPRNHSEWVKERIDRRIAEQVENHDDDLVDHLYCTQEENISEIYTADEFIIEEFWRTQELDEADIYEIEQTRKGFCEDITLPAGFKFIELTTYLEKKAPVKETPTPNMCHKEKLS